MRFARLLLLASLLALIVVPAALALRFTDDSFDIPVGVVGQAYSKQFNGAGGCGPALPYQYSIIGGNLPPGLSMSSAGLISGTPTQTGSWSFWVNLSDQNPPSATWCRPSAAQRQFTIPVVSGSGGAPALSIVPSSLGSRATLVNQPYSFQFTAAGGTSQTWSVKSGALPPGLTLSSRGLLAGTPTVPGDFTFGIQVTDGATTAAQTYTLAIVTPLKIEAPTVPAGEVARLFRLQLSATGGRPLYAWSLGAASALPQGLTLDPATGVISGRPSVAGSFPLEVAVADGLGFTNTVDVRLSFAAKLEITTKLFRPVRAGHAVRIRLRAVGGVGPQTWTLVRGSLPAGIHLSRGTGELSGTARRVRSSRLLVQVADSLGAVSRARLTLTVRG